MRIASLRLLLVSVLLLVGAAGVSGQGPELHIVSPDTETLLTGPSELRVLVTPSATEVREVTIHVDGALACTIRARPFRCTWDAGPRVSARNVRAVAVLADRSRLTATLRTKALDLAETVRVDAVLVSVHVTDSRGRFVRGLTKDDFRLFEDGQPQDFALLVAGEQPAEIVLAVDVSASMAPGFAQLKAAVRDFASRVRPDDHLTIAVFNTDLFVVARRDTPPDRRGALIERLRPWGGTALYDAMVRAVDLLKPYQGRRALVLFTDGDDVSSRGSVDTARAALQAHDVVLYVAAQGAAADDRALGARLAALAEETGGRAYVASRIGSLRGHFADVIEHIAHQYVLSYTPAVPLGDGAWRTLRVELTGRRHTVRARQGYFAVRRDEGR